MILNFMIMRGNKKDVQNMIIYSELISVKWKYRERLNTIEENNKFIVSY